MTNAESDEARSQARKSATTDERLLGRSCESLLGICAGIMADKDLSDEEIRFLDQWLRDNKQIANTWPGEVVYARVQDVLADGVITEDEREHLKQTLTALTDGTLQETPAMPETDETLSVQDTLVIEIPGNSFCFTGTFLFGTQTACERAVTKRGGISVPQVQPDLDYLVVGAMASEGWADTDLIRNIEQAVNYQNEGHNIAIVDEEAWMKHLRFDPS